MLTYRRPPLFFRGRSSGFGSGFGALTGGGSNILLNLVLTSSANSVLFSTSTTIKMKALWCKCLGTRYVITVLHDKVNEQCWACSKHPEQFSRQLLFCLHHKSKEISTYISTHYLLQYCTSLCLGGLRLFHFWFKTSAKNESALQTNHCHCEMELCCLVREGACCCFITVTVCCRTRLVVM